MKKKQYAMKMSDYFQLNRPDYVYLKLIPSTSVKNNKASDIAGVINGTYVDVVKRFKRQNKGFAYTVPHKVSFVIDITKENSCFYMIVPRLHLKEFTQKLTETFGKITIEEVESIKGIRKDCTKYSLTCAKDDSLSLNIDMRDNDLLSSNLSVMDILQDDDRVTILYNFIPSSKMELSSWKNYHSSMIKKYHGGNSLDKYVTAERLVYSAASILQFSIGMIEYATNWLFTGKDKKDDGNKRIIPMNELSKHTSKKENAEILKTQILLMSQSVDSTREKENAKALINTFSVVGDKADNKLVAHKVSDKSIGIKRKKKSNSIGIVKRHKLNKIEDKLVIEEVEELKPEDCMDLTSYNFNLEDNINKMSKEEVGGNFIALAGKTLIEEYKLEATQHNETKIPEELQGGNARYGTNTFRGKDTMVTTSTNEDANCMPVVVMAKMGGGKTSLFENQGVDVITNGEGLISIDFIKNCEMSKNIIRNIPKDKCVIINFADYMCKEGFGFNEISMIRKEDNPMSIYECAILQNAQITQFVDSLGDDEFSAPMGRFLDAACSAVLIHPYKSIKDIVKCLEDYKTRAMYMGLLNEFKETMPEEYHELIEEDLNALEELNEYRDKKDDKGKKTGEREICGTNTAKITGIISRISQLKKNPALKFMYSRGTKNNINLAELMQEGKAIFFEMPQSRFSSAASKNIMVSYLFSKIEIAGIMRAEVYGEENLRTVNVICDEVQQARDSFSNILAICDQLRKFRTKLILSAHGWGKIAPIRDALINAGATIMMLRGSSPKDFDVMKEEFEGCGFTKEDLISLSHTPKYKALCLIATKQGRHGCIVELPPCVKNKIEEEKKKVIEIDLEKKQMIS